MRFELSGTEVYTIECSGVASRAAVRSLVPDAVALPEADDVEVGLLCFAMRGLGATLPLRIGPRFDYAEALWRIGVVWQGAPAWFAVTCDLDRPLVRTMGAMMVRYPVRSAAIVVDPTHATIRCDVGSLEVRARALAESPDPVAPRPLLVASGRSLFRIPWHEDPAPERHAAEVDAVDDGLEHATLGTRVRWSSRGLVHRGRIHRCGFAARISS